MSDRSDNRSRVGAMLTATRLFPRTSSRGAEYLAGRLGNMRVLVMPKRDDDHGEHTHNLLFAEAPQREGGNQ